MQRTRSALGLLLTLTFGSLAFTPSALAWHDEGHVYAARAAVTWLPDDVPAFFTDGIDAVAHCSLNPDVNRSKQLPQLDDANGAEHYLDAELLQGRDWPATRSQFLALCEELDVEPGKVGLLPYAIAERAQALTMAFAEHRQNPENPHVQMRCLFLAGELAHFTADLHMPLHTTIHFDGRIAGDSSKKQHRGIHARVDALPTKIPYARMLPDELTEPLTAVDVTSPELLQMIQIHFEQSHALVDRVYQLEPGIPELPDLELTDEGVRRFTTERMRASAGFTASVILSAWRSSAHVQPAAWLDRSIFDDGFDPEAIPPQPAP